MPWIKSGASADRRSRSLVPARQLLRDPVPAPGRSRASCAV